MSVNSVRLFEPEWCTSVHVVSFFGGRETSGQSNFIRVEHLPTKRSFTVFVNLIKIERDVFKESFDLSHPPSSEGLGLIGS